VVNSFNQNIEQIHSLEKTTYIIVFLHEFTLRERELIQSKSLKTNEIFSIFIKFSGEIVI
jgi:hypothetical protein